MPKPPGTSLTQLDPAPWALPPLPLETFLRESLSNCEPGPCLSATACAGFGPRINRDATTTPAPAAKRTVECATIPFLTNWVCRTQGPALALLHNPLPGKHYFKIAPVSPAMVSAAL